MEEGARRKYRQELADAVAGAPWPDRQPGERPGRVRVRWLSMVMLAVAVGSLYSGLVLSRAWFFVLPVLVLVSIPVWLWYRRAGRVVVDVQPSAWPPVPPGPEPEVLTLRGLPWILTGLVLIGAAATGAGVLTAPVSAPDRAVILGFMLIPLAAGVRLLLARTVLTRTEVVDHGLLRTRRVAVADLARADVQIKLNTMPTLLRSDGGRVPLTSLTSGTDYRWPTGRRVKRQTARIAARYGLPRPEILVEQMRDNGDLELVRPDGTTAG